jgi:1,4-alpha-glucan branching enzyme
MESSRQVWSAEVGYPGDFDYREFYKDIGWELSLGYLGEVIPDGIRKNVGIKYYRVTGKVDLADKKPYERARALHKASVHAEHFLQKRLEQVRAQPPMDRPPLVVSPYDAELFGHWWYEGPEFLNALFRRLAEQSEIQPITPPGYLALHPECEVAQPPQCTWGAKGYTDVWLNPSNDWIYRHLEIAAERMVELATRHQAPSVLEKRALDQAARELLLAQSSDWAFIMKTGTTVEYATKRTRDHIARFTYLYTALSGSELSEAVLAEFEARDSIFPGLDYRIYAPRPEA